MLEQLSSSWWILILLGIGGGIVCGSLGVGSGIIFVPALGLLFLVPQKSAQGIALAVMVPMALLAFFRYWRNPAIEIDMRIVGFLIMGALGGVLVGTEIAAQLPGHWLRKAFAVFIFIVGIRMFFMPAQPKDSSAKIESETLPAATEVKGANNE
ncbi:MAG: sulfite exporter TauE/SafE family protein [Planctomycetota bacterium]|jgi:uncharacterized membrane protein YfcA